MKYAIVIPDGAADQPLDELDGRTPLQAANIPNIDSLAIEGKCGMVSNVPKGMAPGSDVAILSLFGYDPEKCYTGRAPLEAAAQNLQIADDEWVFRCNLVTIIDRVMEDYSGGHISTEEGAKIIEEINTELAGGDAKFYPGVGYRHLLVHKGEFKVRTTPPHDILGQTIEKYLPKGKGSDKLRELMEGSQQLLAQSDINIVRRDLGENPVTSIWLWGEGKMPTLKPFAERYGKSAVAITAVDLVRGISKLIGWDLIEVQGATGYVDTNYAGKGTAAVRAIDDYDIVCVHVEATDEAGHNADVAGKVRALEQIDEHIVGPVLKRLKSEGDDWRMMVLPDHPTPCTIRTHTSDPVPFAIAGKQIESLVDEPFTEETAAKSDLQIARGCELMEYFLTVR